MTHPFVAAHARGAAPYQDPARPPQTSLQDKTSSDLLQLGALDCERRPLVAAADDLHLVAPLRGVPPLDSRRLVVVLLRLLVDLKVGKQWAATSEGVRCLCAAAPAPFRRAESGAVTH